MGMGFQRQQDDDGRMPINFDDDDWGDPQPRSRLAPLPREDNDSWTSNGRVRRSIDMPRIPIGPILIVVLIIVAGILIWTYRDVISSLLITILSWALTVVITIAVIAIILRLIFRPRRW